MAKFQIVFFDKGARVKEFSKSNKTKDLIGFARPEKDGDFNVIVSSSYVAVNSSDEPSLTLGSIGVNESMLIAVDWTQKTKTKKGWMIAAGVIGGAVIGGAVSVVAAPLVVAAIGFTSSGIAAGSTAAGMMSAAAIANGGGVVAGGLVATLQSVGVLGFSAAANVGLAAAGSGIGAGLTGAGVGVAAAMAKDKGKPKRLNRRNEFELRTADGAKKSFRETDTIEDLLKFVKSQHENRDGPFTIILPLDSITIESWNCPENETLEEAGITEASVALVERRQSVSTRACRNPNRVLLEYC